MMKFYHIPEKVLFDRSDELIEWLHSLPKTKRGKDPFMFGNVMTGTISFTWKRDALAYVIKFGGRLVTEDERRRYRMDRSI